MQRTLVIVKPDGVRRRLIGEVISRIEDKGYEIRELKLFSIDGDLARRHYAEHTEKPFFGELVSFITSGPVAAMVVEGPDVIAAVRMIMGPTNPVEAPPGSIRGDYASAMTENIVHGSDSPKAAAREVDLFFGESL
ncbi:MAG: nucleoside-diphosphate kinase [Actinomycetota bacterium]|nr:nucleoside-diphosphate kinase [Actinomycetota bacterium]